MGAFMGGAAGVFLGVFYFANLTVKIKSLWRVGSWFRICRD